ncbi:hypothetical protein [Brevundimonas sp. TWP2-3-4b1]
MEITFWGWVFISTVGLLSFLSLILAISLRFMLRQHADPIIP